MSNVPYPSGIFWVILLPVDLLSKLVRAECVGTNVVLALVDVEATKLCIIGPSEVRAHEQCACVHWRE